jgi:Copper transport outer membrane protein, MctB
VIDFRYHLVSIIAVFLALAVGLLVGSTALSGKAVEALTAAQRAALNKNASLQKQVGMLNSQVTADQAFATAASKRLLDGLLTNQKVVIVTAPGFESSMIGGLRTALTEAGATVTGEVDLQPAFLTTTGQTETALTGLAQQLAAQAGLTLSTQSSSGVSGQQAAAQVLAASLLTSDGTGLSASTGQHILSGLSQGGYVSVASGGPAPAPASLAILVTPGGTPPQTGSKVLVATALALKNAGTGTVLAGPVSAIGASSVISAEDSAGNVSTVDNADTESGQIMTVWALYYARNGKPAGQYGIGPAVAPSPAPSPSSTPAVTPSTGVHK